ncbi:MAG: CDP-alcohol phosphatidyltransferase family protein [Flavobacterium sp.]|nr:CDP-alcohol phosphatidyltransferase family protein [Flavobacterium sp.]
MNIKKQIPNIITLSNLFCGCIALVFVAKLDYENAFYFVCLGIFLDFFDGFFARLFKVASPLGLQLDSLADMVTSGVVPGFVMFQMFQNLEKNPNIISTYSAFGFLITLGACYRLANFNIDERQSDSFIGLPTPANTLYIMSLPLIFLNADNEFIKEILANRYVLMAMTVFSAFIMNAEIPLFSLKMKSFNLKVNLLQIVFLMVSVSLLLFFKFLGVAFVISFYVILSIVRNLKLKK